MTKKLERIGNGGNGPEWKRLNVHAPTHEKLVKLCKKQNVKLFEMIRFLVDVASEGQIDFDQGE
jgi:hypothetical protein